MPPREEDMVAPVARYFQRDGWHAAPEIAFNRRIADLILVKDDMTAAVELKLRDWRGAHKQAQAYQVGCGWSWIGLPLVVAAKIAARPEAMRALDESGVGLLGVNWPQPADDDGDVRVLKPAEPSRRLLPFLEDGVRDAALDVTYEPGEALPQPGYAVSRVGRRRG